jgi:Flp pilus assembly protein TadD
MLALVYSRMGRTAEARTILRELLETARHQYVPPSAIGGVYGALGEDETALEWLERSYEEGSNFVAYMSVEPSQQRLRAHPRFQAILQRTGQH